MLAFSALKKAKVTLDPCGFRLEKRKRKKNIASFVFVKKQKPNLSMRN